MFRTAKLNLLFLCSLSGLLIACTPHVELAPLAIKAAAPNTVAFVINNYCSSSTQSFSDFFVLLRSARIQDGQVLSDFGRDGIPDVEKTTLGLNLFNGDQGNTGYGNLVLFKAGIPIDQFSSVPRCSNPGLSSVPGFLNDCDRNLLQLKLTLQSVVRGIPDDIALWFGLDLNDPAVANGNPSGDGITNINKVKLNTNIDETLTAATQALTPVYDIQQTPASNGNTCYTFSVSNIPLVDVSNGNEVDAYVLTQDPEGNVNAKVANIIFTPLNSASTLELDYASF